MIVPCAYTALLRGSCLISNSASLIFRATLFTPSSLLDSIIGVLFTLLYLALISTFILYVGPCKDYESNFDRVFPKGNVRISRIKLSTFYYKQGHLKASSLNVIVSHTIRRCSEDHERNRSRHPRLRIVHFTTWLALSLSTFYFTFLCSESL